jgi:hypothetical protein
MRWDRLPKNQPAEITMFQISEVQEAPAFNGRRSFLALRGPERCYSTELEISTISAQGHLAEICNRRKCKQASGLGWPVQQ